MSFFLFFIMNVWIVYDSKFGNNKRIADLLATHLKDMNNVQVAYAKTISPQEVIDSGVDVFLFGGPLRAGNISFTMKRWALKFATILKKQNKMLKQAAVWGSHGTNDPKTPPNFSWESSKLKWKAVLDLIPAEKKVSEVIGFDVNPTTLEGPLVPGWEEIVMQFALMIKNL